MLACTDKIRIFHALSNRTLSNVRQIGRKGKKCDDDEDNPEFHSLKVKLLCDVRISFLYSIDVSSSDFSSFANLLCYVKVLHMICEPTLMCIYCNDLSVVCVSVCLFVSVSACQSDALSSAVPL